MRLSPILLTVGILAAPAAAQQTDYRFELVPAQSQINWNVTSSLGTIVVSPSTFEMTGTMDVVLDAPVIATSGEIVEGFLMTDPTTLGGTIPNPFPFLPPLGAFSVDDLQASIEAPTFAISPTGQVTLTATLTTVGGTITTSGLIGNGTESLHGISSAPTTTTATVSVVGSSLIALMNINVTLSLAVAGGTVDVTLQGVLRAEADTGLADPMRLAAARPLNAGGPASFSVTNAPTGQPLFLGATLQGPGMTNVLPLGVVVQLHNPIQAGGPVFASPAGIASFNANVPANLAGRAVLLQVATSGEVSNLVGTWIQ